jgi:N,N-dimethylformamidase
MSGIRPLAYSDNWTFDAGAKLAIKASGVGAAKLQLQRLRGLVGQGVPTNYLVENIGGEQNVDLAVQITDAGSCAFTQTGPSAIGRVAWTWTLTLFPTLVDRGCVLDWGNGAVRLCIDAGHLVATMFGLHLSVPVDLGHWSEVLLSNKNGIISLQLTPTGSGIWYRQRHRRQVEGITETIVGPLCFGLGFNGKIGAPKLEVDGAVVAAWNFADDMHRQSVPGTGPQSSRLNLKNAPRRAVVGALWDGSHHDWTVAPQHYDAIYFHDDDLDDTRWKDTATIDLPDDIQSGIYAVRVSGGGGVHHVPLFVRPKRVPKVVFLASTLSYLAYGNSIWASQGASRINTNYPEEAAAMRACGLSTYARHRDGSGVGQVSMRRPILSVSPGFLGEAAGGQVLLNDDLRIIAWLDQTGEDYGVITEHDLHEFGFQALGGCRVLITGSHPEYQSSQTLDAIERFLKDGGRLINLGGNGFYWRVSTLPEVGHVMELRRTEGGVRMWDEPIGEYRHQSDGQSGGLWSRLGRPSNRLVGVGFSAQGEDDTAQPYTRTSAANNARAAFLFEGVAEGPIGAKGAVGAAGGYEVDRADTHLGTPPHALVIARTLPFASGLFPVNEERLTHTLLKCDDPLRADITFFESQNGGAVLSTGSVLFATCLGEADGAGRLATNALKRFVDAEPFSLPKSALIERAL